MAEAMATPTAYFSLQNVLIYFALGFISGVLFAYIDARNGDIDERSMPAVIFVVLLWPIAAFILFFGMLPFAIGTWLGSKK